MMGTVVPQILGPEVGKGQFSFLLHPNFPTEDLSGPRCDDYYPIANVPFLHKVFEHVVAGQHQMFLEETDYLDSFQSGFRHMIDTKMALVVLNDDLLQVKTRGESGPDDSLGPLHSFQYH